MRSKDKVFMKRDVLLAYLALHNACPDSICYISKSYNHTPCSNLWNESPRGRWNHWLVTLECSPKIEREASSVIYKAEDYAIATSRISEHYPKLTPKDQVDWIGRRSAFYFIEKFPWKRVEQMLIRRKLYIDLFNAQIKYIGMG